MSSSTTVTATPVAIQLPRLNDSASGRLNASAVSDHQRIGAIRCSRRASRASPSAASIPKLTTTDIAITSCAPKVPTARWSPPA